MGVIAACGIAVGFSVRAFAAPETPPPTPKPVFEQYCFSCHGAKPMAGISLTKLTSAPVGDNFALWQKVAAVLDQNRMPPKGLPQPSVEQHGLAAAWVKAELGAFANKNAGDPGRVTVRRLTSGEYAYSIRDLTGIDLDIGRDFANDSVGGEGFMNFGDVQFMQDASLERYLESAKLIADHAVIGAGPIEFYTHPGKTGFELSAISRVKDIYSAAGFRTVSGEGGDSFGLDKYRRAFFVAWEYAHRNALGKPNATIAELAAREKLSTRFAEHIYTVVNTPGLSYPASEVAARWKRLPASEAKARKGAEELEQFVTSWPSWLFARGDKAVGGAGDESPLLFTDAALKPELSHKFTYIIRGRGIAGKPQDAAAEDSTAKVFLVVDPVMPEMKEPAMVVWRNPTISIRRGPAPGAMPTAEVTAAGQAGGVGENAGAKAARQFGGPKTPLKDYVTPQVAAQLKFGAGPEGLNVGPNDFVTIGSSSFEVNLPKDAQAMAFQVEAAFGNQKAQVLRVTFSDRADGPVRAIPVHALLGNPVSDAAKHLKAGVLQLVELLPPNSHGEPTPADKDPPPAPFDATFNSPEHDAFDNRVKYARDDRFVTQHVLDDATLTRLDRAWTDLHSSFEYYDSYLALLADHFHLTLASQKMADLTAAQLAALPEEARKYIAPLRSEYLETLSAEAAARPAHLENCLEFASRAWRRPLTDSEQVSLRAFYRRTLLEEKDHTKAVRALIARILVSPAFLYRVELASGPPLPAAKVIASVTATGIASVTASGTASAAKPLSGWELASRLSYFLWSSLPDDALRHAAETGELNTPEGLHNQVKRMLADDKARRMSAEFFGQWLGFYRFDQYKGVETSRFPEFTDEVKAGMYDEAVSFCEYIIRQDRPVNDLMSADYTFLTKPLAKYYGVNQVIQSNAAAQKVDGANSFQRGGVLRLGAVLTVTSAPLRTSPVKRGDWVLRRILGTPTPPPPADAGSIPADDKLFGGLSLRDKLEAHKRNATCAGCHTRIDPLGFPLEHYDATGRWRTSYADGKAIYDAGKTFDNYSIEGAQGLLNYLKTKDEQVRRTLAMKMIGYALGRTVLPSDMPLVDRMVALGGGSPFSKLVVEIASSRQFLNHAGREAAAASQVAKINTDTRGLRP